MAYGIIKVDSITFTNGGVDQTVTVSGIVQSISGDITATGTIQGATIIGTSTVSGATVTGDAGQFITATAATGVFTSTLSGATITGNTASFTTITGGTVTLTSGVFASGTAAAPSVSVGTTDNGLYSPGADQVAISTNGTQRLSIAANGTLAVTSASAATASFTGPANAYVDITDGTGIFRTQLTSNIPFVGAASNHALVFTTNNTEKLRLSATGDLNFKGAGTAGVTQAVSFNGSAPVNSLVIDSSGRVGLGSSSPLSQLSNVSSNGGLSSANSTGIAWQSTANEWAGVISSRPTSGSGYALRAHTEGTTSSDYIFWGGSGSGTGTSRFVITGAGAVGIGTTSPSDTNNFGNALDVNGTTGSALYVRTNGSATDFGIIGHYGTDFYVNNNSNGPTRFFTNGSERVRIDSSGRLLVGTSSDVSGGEAAALIQSVYSTGALTSIGRDDTTVNNGDFIGGIDFHTKTGASSTWQRSARILCYADADQGSGDAPGRLTFSTTADGASSPTERMRLSNDGTLTCQGVFDQTTANAANVQVDAAGVVRRSTSSAKYKTDIETLQDSYADAILNVRPVWYRSTCEADNPNYGWWGFIAEEVAAIDPRLVHWKTVEVTYDENGSPIEAPCGQEPEGVQYDRFVPHLLNLIKRQGEAIAELQAKVAALEAQ
jgi:hypothetical protein